MTLTAAITERDLRSIYTRAADWLEAHEWIQGCTARNAKGRELNGVEQVQKYAVSACAGGAIYAVAPDLKAGLTAWDAMFPLVGSSLHAWNDAPGRTKAEVIAKLRQAAASAGAP